MLGNLNNHNPKPRQSAKPCCFDVEAGLETEIPTKQGTLPKTETNTTQRSSAYLGSPDTKTKLQSGNRAFMVAVVLGLTLCSVMLMGVLSRRSSQSHRRSTCGSPDNDPEDLHVPEIDSPEMQIFRIEEKKKHSPIFKEEVNKRLPTTITEEIIKKIVGTDDIITEIVEKTLERYENLFTLFEDDEDHRRTSITQREKEQMQKEKEQRQKEDVCLEVNHIIRGDIQPCKNVGGSRYWTNLEVLEFTRNRCNITSNIKNEAHHEVFSETIKNAENSGRIVRDINGAMYCESDAYYENQFQGIVKEAVKKQIESYDDQMEENEKNDLISKEISWIWGDNLLKRVNDNDDKELRPSPMTQRFKM